MLRGSLVSFSLEAAIINAKYVNAVPLYRREQEFLRYGLHVSRQNMANWTIQCMDRYLAVLYDYLHEKMYGYHALQVDERPVLVNKDNRPDANKSYMRVYCTGRMYTNRQKDFSGICVTDGYQVYHTIENEREELRIARCWFHVRRGFDEEVKALSKARQKDSCTYFALIMIQAIYREEKQLKVLPAHERQDSRWLSVRLLVEAYFTWFHERFQKVPQKSKIL